MKPKLFIGSSIEARPAAKQVAWAIRTWCDSDVWTEGFFRPGGSTASTIERKVSEYDGAVFILSPDDLLLSRDQAGPFPRANVLFELGMFGAALGLANCILLVLKAKPDGWTDITKAALSLPSPGDTTAGGAGRSGHWTERTGVNPISDLAGITYIEVTGRTDCSGSRRTFFLDDQGLAKVGNEFERLRDWDARLLGSTLGVPPANLISIWKDGDREHESIVEACVFGDRMRCRYQWDGDGRSYELSVQLEGEGLLWGHWWDPREASYGGFAQFQIRSQPSYLLGAWLGWSTNGGVKCGPYILARKDVLHEARADAYSVRVGHWIRPNLQRFIRRLRPTSTT